jgi:hypothetical protein
MGTQFDVFREEDLILDHMDQVGRLDKERELDRLVNVLNDILIEHSTLESNEIERVYNEVKRRLEREYYRTEVLGTESTGMKVWHLSIFSSIELLQKLLVNKGFDESEDILRTFDKILDEHFEEQLQRFSKKYDIVDLGKRLPEPEVFLQDDLEVLYWYDMGYEQYEFTGRKETHSWQTESKSGPREVEVRI